MALDILLAQYPKQAHVRDRNYAGLIAWSASIVAAPIPDEPEPAWVRQRIVAEQMPARPLDFVERTLGFFLQDPATVTNIREYLSAWNDEAAETALSAQIAAVITAFMPRFAAIEVGAGQIANWFRENGLEVPPEIADQVRPPGWPMPPPPAPMPSAASRASTLRQTAQGGAPPPPTPSSPPAGRA